MARARARARVRDWYRGQYTYNSWLKLSSIYGISHKKVSRYRSYNGTVVSVVSVQHPASFPVRAQDQPQYITYIALATINFVDFVVFVVERQRAS